MEQQNPVVPTPASEWQGKVELAGVDLPLPSGNVARIRPLTPTAFLTSGLVPDPLSAIITKAIATKQGLPPKKVQEMAKDPEKIQASLELFDRVVSHVAVQPAVLMPPKCIECGEYANVDERHLDRTHVDFHPYKEGERRTDVLYADQLDLADKIFIFQFCTTGVRDLETFRRQFTASLGGVRQQQDVQHQA